MPLDIANLSASLRDAMRDSIGTPITSAQFANTAVLAATMATAIDTFVKSGTVTTTVAAAIPVQVVPATGTGATTGTGAGSGSIT